MNKFSYTETNEVEFDITIPEELFFFFSQEVNDKPFTYLTSNNVIIYAHGKVVKWLLDNNCINTIKIRNAFETGFLEGFKDIEKAYIDKYVIGEEKIVDNLREVYSKFKIIREFEFHSINETLMMFYGNACGITHCIEQLTAIYPIDFQGFFLNFKNISLVENEIIKQFWNEYKSALPENIEPESYERFGRRFCLNTECVRLFPKGRSAGDEYSKARDWLVKMLTQLKIISNGKYSNFDKYTKQAFGIPYSKIGHQKKREPK